MLSKWMVGLALGLALAGCESILKLDDVPRPHSCGEVTCGADERCVAGSCLAKTCPGVTCAEGAVCSGEQCIPEACVGATCEKGTTCAEGQCLPVACGDATTCAEGSVCKGGACVDPLCLGVHCSNGSICTGGVCTTSCTASDCSRPECLGRSCDDSDACTVNEVCTASGGCEGTPMACDSPPEKECSELGYCDAESGECVYPPRPSDTICAANLRCTEPGSCDGKGHCVVPLAASICSAPDGDCSTALGCDESRGGCLFSAMPKGTECSDNNPCTTGDACDGAGRCVPEKGQACNTPPNNQCWNAQGACDGKGGCTYTKKATETTCDDGNPCTVGDRCDANGNCAGTAMVCNKPPACHSGGRCASGACVYDFAPNGSSCPDDGNPCTNNYCSNGVCRHDALKNGTACPLGHCCAGRCSNLRETAHCGACGAACRSGSSCKSTGTGGYACNCTGANTSDAFCNSIYGGSATCYQSMCNCQKSCPNGAVCHVVSGNNYCDY